MHSAGLPGQNRMSTTLSFSGWHLYVSDILGFLESWEVAIAGTKKNLVTKARYPFYPFKQNLRQKTKQL